MKLLILTQKVDKNDPILGFFHRWIEEFSKYYESVLVICLEKGEYKLPKNVEVLSLGKEKNISRMKYIFRFYKYIFSRRKDYDKVFVHMNQVYIILGGLLWRIWNKKIGLWYTHKQIGILLRIAEKTSNVIFSASKYSFNLNSKKLYILGHGIDIDSFKCESRKVNKKLSIISVGRITKIKRCHILIETANLLNSINKNFKITFIGDPITKNDQAYLKSLKKLIEKYNLENHISFEKGVPNNKIQKFYCDANISINLTPTGGLDKTVIESMASGTIVLSSNKAFGEYFGKYSQDLIFEENNTQDLMNKIESIQTRDDKSEISKFLQKESKENFNIEKIILNIHNLLS